MHVAKGSGGRATKEHLFFCLKGSQGPLEPQWLSFVVLPDSYAYSFTLHLTSVNPVLSLPSAFYPPKIHYASRLF